MKRFLVACLTCMLFAVAVSANVVDPAFNKYEQYNSVWTSIRRSANDTIPAWLRGKFIDDYRISYSISNDVWTQQDAIRYHIIKWNMAGQYLIAKNDSANPSEKGLYTRIDFMQFENMEPYQWGFCLTVYDALSAESAERNKPADRSNPRKGCNGFPFSRMKRSQDQ